MAAKTFVEQIFDEISHLCRNDDCAHLAAALVAKLVKERFSSANTGSPKLPLNCFACSKRFKVSNCGCCFGDSDCQTWQLRAASAPCVHEWVSGMFSHICNKCGLVDDS